MAAPPKDLSGFIPDTLVKKIVKVLDEALDAEMGVGEDNEQVPNYNVRLQAAELAIRIRAGWHKPQVNINLGGPQQFQDDARDWIASARSVVEMAKGRTIDLTVEEDTFDASKALE